MWRDLIYIGFEFYGERIFFFRGMVKVVFKEFLLSMYFLIFRILFLELYNFKIVRGLKIVLKIVFNINEGMKGEEGNKW